MIINIPHQVNTALEILSAAGHKAYVVGGAVRDAVMGREPGDWDVTTSASPEETEKAFEGYHIIETGLRHGTVTVRIEHTSIEITTFRIDKGYSDNRHPDAVEFTDDINLDLARRDFTCNAIAYNPAGGFIDPFGGRKDIENKIIRCVGEPDRRFNEDGLRILRALRFSCVLGFEIEENTARSIHENVSLLDNISRERILVELSKMLPCCKADFLLEYSDVIFRIIPELEAEKGCTQHHERHIYDVWQHSCVALENSPPDYAVRFAVLLHDIGKPQCKSTDEKGIDHFYGHGKAGAEIARRVMRNLKASNALTGKVVTLVEYHDFVPDKLSIKTYRKYLGILGENTLRELFAVREADMRGQNPAFLPESLEQNRKGLETLEKILADEKCFSLKDLAVNGRDLIDAGFESSPELGRILSLLFDEVISDKTANEKSALLERAKELK